MTFEKVKEIMADTINCDEESVTLEASLKDDLGIDSLDAMELCMVLEEKFNLTIEEEALQGFIKVSDIVDYIEAHA